LSNKLEPNPQDVADLEPSLLSIVLSLVLTKLVKSCLSNFDKTVFLIVQKMVRVKRFHSKQLARPIDSKQQAPNQD
jgi:hypothetical protein